MTTTETDSRRLRLGTRGSRLALTQSGQVAEALMAAGGGGAATAAGKASEGSGGLGIDDITISGVLALVMAAAHAGSTVTTDSVNLINEDDGRSGLLGLFEEVAHTGGTDADEHLDEVRTRDGEERHSSLPGHCTGQQGLAGTRRAIQQYSFGDLGTDPLEFRRLGEEFTDLLQLVDRLLATRDVGEG